MQKLMPVVAVLLLSVGPAVLSAHAAVSSKYSAWAVIWRDGYVPVQLLADAAGLPQLDVRQERQYAGPCNVTLEDMAYYQNPISGYFQYTRPNYCDSDLTRLRAFAAANPGHLYFTGDEPDQFGITPAHYAKWFHRFVTEIRSADPTALFSTGGFGTSFTNPTHHITYAGEFSNAYRALAGGSPPPLAEWRFNLNLSAPWQQHLEIAAAWSVSSGAPAVVSASTEAAAGVNVLPWVQELIDRTKDDPRVLGVVYWNYDLTVASHHTILDPLTGGLSAVGQLYASYARGTSSLPNNSISTLGDFNADGYADFADHTLPGGHFWMHLNNGNGTFQPPGQNWGEGDSPATSEWETLVADFTHDGFADFAPVHLPTGRVWIFQNLGNGSFYMAQQWAFVQLDFAAGSEQIPGVPAQFEVLAGDVNGDGLADLLTRRIDSGLLWAYLNTGTASGFQPHGEAIARTRTGPEWRTIVADFTGDGRADYADQYLPTGTFWVHKNTGGPHFRMSTLGAGSGSPSGGTEWRTIVGDFTGDGFDDYADLSVTSGLFYVHRNLQNGTFQPPGQNWGIGQATPGASWQILGSR